VERPRTDAASVPEAVAVGEPTHRVLEQVGDGREARVRVRGKRRDGHPKVVQIEERIEGKVGEAAKAERREPGTGFASGKRALAPTERGVSVVKSLL
jgi:hypothetical protein